MYCFYFCFLGVQAKRITVCSHTTHANSIKICMMHSHHADKPFFPVDSDDEIKSPSKEAELVLFHYNTTIIDLKPFDIHEHRLEGNLADRVSASFSRKPAHQQPVSTGERWAPIYATDSRNNLIDRKLSK